VPSADQVAVPTDVVPVYDLEALLRGTGVLQGDGFDFSLWDAQGEEVAFTQERVGSSHIAIKPAAELLPFSTYVFDATLPQLDAPEQALQLSFTTGAGPLGELPLPPLHASLQRFSAPQGGGAVCEPAEGLCVALPAGELIEVTFLDQSQDVPAPALHAGSYLTFLPPLTAHPAELCLQLRRRALNGSFSAPEVVCGPFNEVSVLEGNPVAHCTDQGLVEVARVGSASNLHAVQGGDEPEPEASSCSVGRSGSGAGRAFSATLIAAVCALLRRRHARQG